MPKPVKRAWKCWWTWDPTNLTHLYPFTKNPEWLFGYISYSQAHHPLGYTGAFLSLSPRVGPFGDFSTVRADQVWEGFIHIEKLYFNTEVSLYKLLTRHRELSVCGPKLKRQLLAPLASEEKSVKPFPVVSHFLVGKVFPCIRYGHI